MARTSVSGVATQHSKDVARVVHREFNLLLDELDRLRTALVGTGVLVPTVMSRGSTDTHVATTAFTFHILGVAEARAAEAAGTAIGAQTVPADHWACYKASIAAGGTITHTPAAANATTGYDTEAEAIAALPATPAGESYYGHFTVKTATGVAWVAGTDALEGGSSGSPASDTNFYPEATTIGTDSTREVSV